MSSAQIVEGSANTLKFIESRWVRLSPTSHLFASLCQVAALPNTQTRRCHSQLPRLADARGGLHVFDSAQSLAKKTPRALQHTAPRNHDNYEYIMIVLIVAWLSFPFFTELNQSKTVEKIQQAHVKHWTDGLCLDKMPLMMLQHQGPAAWPTGLAAVSGFDGLVAKKLPIWVGM